MVYFSEWLRIRQKRETAVITIQNTIEYHDETAWALEYPDTMNQNWDLTDSNNWGWFIGDYDTDTGEGYGYDTTTSEAVDFDLWAGAGDNDTDNGTLVGHITVDLDTTQEKVTVTYHTDSGFDLLDTHLWIGETPLPMDKKDRYKDAPGQFKVDYSYVDTENHIYEYQYDPTKPLYIAAHAVVRIYGD